MAEKSPVWGMTRVQEAIEMRGAAMMGKQRPFAIQSMID